MAELSEPLTDAVKALIRIDVGSALHKCAKLYGRDAVIEVLKEEMKKGLVD